MLVLWPPQSAGGTSRSGGICALAAEAVLEAVLEAEPDLNVEELAEAVAREVIKAEAGN